MPQKKNPDAAELLRAKAPRVVGRLVSLHGVLHGLPLTYNKDLQEDKEGLFDATDTVELTLRVASEMLGEIRFDRERMAAAASDEFIAATDLADHLVREGVPFREAHGIVGGIVRAAVDRGKKLSELTEAELAELAPQLDGRYYELLEQGAWLESKVSTGGTALSRDTRSAGPGAARPGRGGGLRLGRAFYARSVHDVARELVGCTVHHAGAAGRIVETESYHMEEPACHAHAGVTSRTRTLFGPPGRAYVYFSYGVHSLLNAVCEDEGTGAAVLIRALEPVEGIELMRARRGLERAEDLCSGPGKLTQALDIGLSLNGSSLIDGPIELRAREPSARPPRIVLGERVGITKAVDLPWRFCDADSRHVSRPWPAAMRTRSAA